MDSPVERPVSDDHKGQQYMLDFIRITIKENKKDNNRFKRSLIRVGSIKNVRDRGAVGCLIEIDGTDFRTKEKFDQIQNQMATALIAV